MKTQKILLLLIAAATLFSCSEQENPADRTSTVKLGYAVEQINPKAAQGSDTTAPQSTPKQMVVTIHDEDGHPVLNGERFDLVKIGEEYYSKSILLPTGHYTLEEFMVIDSADQAIYIAPKSGSEMADFVEHPLPRSFQVEADQDTELLVQVVPAWLGSASEFGYVSFPFEVVNPSAFGESPGLCATYEEDKLRLNACYDSKECLIGSWRFKAFIDTDSCLVKYNPDSAWGKPLDSSRYDNPWIQFHDNNSLSGETMGNTIVSGKYTIKSNNSLQFSSTEITAVNEPEWGIMFYENLFVDRSQDSAMWTQNNKFVTFQDTLYIYNLNSKFLFVKKR